MGILRAIKQILQKPTNLITMYLNVYNKRCKSLITCFSIVFYDLPTTYLHKIIKNY